MTTHLVIPDTQVKPGVPTDNLRWFGLYAAEKMPDVIVHLGDHWDMPSLSSYDKGKRAMEGRRYRADVQAGNDGMALLNAGIEEGIKKDGLVQLIGFGTFQVKERSARKGRNPKTGEEIKIKASKTVSFKVGAALMQRLHIEAHKILLNET